MADPALAVLAWQVERSPLMSDMMQFVMFTAGFVLVVGVAMYFIIRKLRPKLDNSASAAVRDEFEKSKDALLLAAQAKKAAKEKDEAAQRAVEKEQKERELLAENVNPQDIIGKNCPLSGLEMEADQELVIDPYTGQGYHYSSFVNDWPAGQERPKYVYRYPHGTVVKTENMITEW
jgi:hypothetical protein